MKIRILSDLHLIENRHYPFRLYDKDTFTVICGDISGSIQKTSQWLDQNIHNGLFIGGNHMFYAEPDLTIEQIEKIYAKKYPLENSVSFLNNQFKIIDGIVFVGCTLWADFKLFGAQAVRFYKHCALFSKIKDDFRYGQVLQNGKVVPLSPEYCVNAFQKSVAYIGHICEKYSNKPIVVLTHHAPSILSIDKPFLKADITPSCASNLDKFILNHPNIKLWCHGHIHSFKDYHIGGCRVICNPRGYPCFHQETGFKKRLILEINKDSTSY